MTLAQTLHLKLSAMFKNNPGRELHIESEDRALKCPWCASRRSEQGVQPLLGSHGSDLIFAVCAEHVHLKKQLCPFHFASIRDSMK